MSSLDSDKWQNCKSKISGNLITIYDGGSTWGKCGAFISNEGVTALKEPCRNAESLVAPLEHYHTMLIDEKYQNHDYFFDQNDYSVCRKQLIETLFDIGKRLRQTESTVYLAVGYMDIILNSDNAISKASGREHFKLIAVVCLNIASKFDALDLNTPLVNELQRASGVHISFHGLVEYERECLKILNWQLKNVTLFHCTDVIKHQGLLMSNDTRNSGRSIEEDFGQIAERARILLDYFADLILKDIEFLRFKPSIQASACLLATRMCLNIDKPWNNAIAEMLLYDKEDIQPAYLLFEQKYGFLIEVAESVWVRLNSSQSADRQSQNRTFSRTTDERISRFEERSGKKNNRERLDKRMEILNSLSFCFNYHPPSRNGSRNQDSPQESKNESGSSRSFYKSDESLRDYKKGAAFTDNGGEDYMLYEHSSGMKAPYNLDEDDLRYINEALHYQMLYDQNPLAHFRSVSMGSDVCHNYKDKISSLLGGKTKGSTPDKENLEDPGHEDGLARKQTLEEGKPSRKIVKERDANELAKNAKGPGAKGLHGVHNTFSNSTEIDSSKENKDEERLRRKWEKKRGKEDKLTKKRSEKEVEDISSKKVNSESPGLANNLHKINAF